MPRFSMIAKIATASLMTVFVGMSANAADRISDFSLTDSDGRFFQLSRHGDEQAIVLFTFDPFINFFLFDVYERIRFFPCKQKKC